MSEIRKTRYDRAIEWLKGVMKGDITIADAPRLPAEEAASNSPWQIASDEVRPTEM